MTTKVKICFNCQKEFIWSRDMSFTKMNCSPKCHSQWMSSKRFKENNPAWKDDKATIGSIHCWIRDNFKRTNVCSVCGKNGNTDWSNKDHLYKRNKKYWQELCRSCHQKYDFKKGLRVKKK